MGYQSLRPKPGDGGGKVHLAAFPRYAARVCECRASPKLYRSPSPLVRTPPDQILGTETQRFYLAFNAAAGGPSAYQLPRLFGQIRGGDVCSGCASRECVEHSKRELQLLLMGFTGLALDPRRCQPSRRGPQVLSESSAPRMWANFRYRTGGRKLRVLRQSKKLFSQRYPVKMCLSLKVVWPSS